MKQVSLQRKGNSLVPFSKEDGNDILSFTENQIITAKLTGSRKQRSLQQNKWIHAMFRLVAMNSDDHEWDTAEKVKRNVKMAMRFFKDDVIVNNNKVYFELRSFAFDKMEHSEANIKYEEAKNICSKHLGCTPEELEAEAKREN